MNIRPLSGFAAGRRFSLNFWSVVMALSVAIIALILVWPLVQVLVLGFYNPESSDVSFGGYGKLLTYPYYLGALWNTLFVGVCGMAGACLLGVPLV